MREELEFDLFSDFCDRAELLRKRFIALNSTERRHYKDYIYRHQFVLPQDTWEHNNKLCEVIWEYLVSTEQTQRKMYGKLLAKCEEAVNFEKLG